MAESKKGAKSTKTTRRRRVARTQEEREREMTALAMDQAEEMLRNHTAPTQVVLHYLRLASPRERAELEMINKRSENLDAKTESIRQGTNVEALYEKAINALKEYNGQYDYDEDIQ